MLNLALQAAAQSSSDQSPPRGTRLITIPEMQLPGVAGVTIRIRRHWPWQFVADCVARCRDLGKLYTLLVIGGDVSAPYHPDHILSRQRIASKLAAAFGEDPLLWGVHASLPPTGHSEELFGKPMQPSVIEKNQKFIKFHADEFPARVNILTAGSGNDPSAMRQIIRYGITVAPGRFLYKNNAMSAKSPIDWISNQLVIEAMKAGARGGFEMLCGSNEARFRDRNDRTPAAKLYAKAMATVAEIERLAGKQIDYLAPYKYDLKKLGVLP